MSCICFSLGVLFLGIFSKVGVKANSLNIYIYQCALSVSVHLSFSVFLWLSGKALR